MPTKSAQLHPYLAQLHQLCVCNCKKLTVTSRNLSVTARYFSVTAFLSLVHRRRGGDAPSARGEEIDCNITSKTIKIIYTQKSPGDFFVDLSSIFCGSFVDFRGSFVDFRRFSSIFVDFRGSFVDFRRFSSIFVDLLWIFCRFGVGGVDSGPIWSGFLRAAEGMALPSALIWFVDFYRPRTKMEPFKQD
jgi:hypothetical protein